MFGITSITTTTSTTITGPILNSTQIPASPHTASIPRTILQKNNTSPSQAEGANVSGRKIKIPETPIAGNAGSMARGSADLFWGYLFDESKCPPEPKPILKEFFEGLAGYLVSFLIHSLLEDAVMFGKKGHRWLICL